MVREHLRFLPYWAIEHMGIHRGDTLWVRESLLEGVQNIVGLLFALNRSYHPGKLKGLKWWLERLEIQPPNLWSRLESCLQAPQAEALQAYQLLLGETLELVAEKVPEVELSVARRRLAAVLRQ
jgi:hypothetical protein